MADKTNMELTQLNGAAEKWKEANTYFEGNCGNGTFTSSLSRLTSGDDLAVATNYAKMIEDSINDILAFSKEEQGKFASLYTDIKPPATSDPPGGTDNPPGGTDNPPIVNNPPGGGGTNNPPVVNNPPGGTGTEVTPVDVGTPVNPDDPTEPVEEPEIVVSTVDLEALDVSSLEDMELSDLDSFIGMMKDLAKQKNQKLDEFFNDEENADDIKKLILESPYIPQAFKDYISDLDSEVARQIIKYMLTGGYPNIFDINPLNLGIIYRYLENIAKEKGITVTELLADTKYASILRTVLEDFGNVVELLKGWEELEPEQLQSYMLQLYEGNEVEDIPAVAIDVTRCFVDYICEEVGIDYEELLTDTVYAEDIKTAALEFGNTLAFFAMTAAFTDEGMMNNISSLYDGTNYKALGMYEDSTKEFKDKIDEVAKEKNVTSEELLSDTQYAQDVKDAMADCEATKSVESIFKNDDAEVSQKVAKNIYNTDYEKKDTFELKVESDSSTKDADSNLSDSLSSVNTDTKDSKSVADK